MSVNHWWTTGVDNIVPEQWSVSCWWTTAGIHYCTWAKKVGELLVSNSRYNYTTIPEQRRSVSVNNSRYTLLYLSNGPWVAGEQQPVYTTVPEQRPVSFWWTTAGIYYCTRTTAREFLVNNSGYILLYLSNGPWVSGEQQPVYTTVPEQRRSVSFWRTTAGIYYCTWAKKVRELLADRSLLSMAPCTLAMMASSCRKCTSCLVGWTLTSTFCGEISRLKRHRPMMSTICSEISRLKWHRPMMSTICSEISRLKWNRPMTSTVCSEISRLKRHRPVMSTICSEISRLKWHRPMTSTIYSEISRLKWQTNEVYNL